MIAREFATDHHQIRVAADELVPPLGGAIRAMSEPMVSHDCVAFYLLSEEVAKHLKVVQSGQGADEVFGGYHWYPPLLGVAGDEAVGAYAKVFFDRDPAEMAEVLNPEYLAADPRASSSPSTSPHPAPRPRWTPRCASTPTVMLVDDPVKRVDNMTMACGLEARVPFLDHEFVELAAQPARRSSSSRRAARAC